MNDATTQELNSALDQTDKSIAGNDDGWEWALLEICGFRKHAGRCREVERFGAKLLRIDVPTVKTNASGQLEATAWETHFYSGQSMFSYTPTTEAVVLQANKRYEPPSLYLRPPLTPDPMFAEVEEPPEFDAGVDCEPDEQDHDEGWAGSADHAQEPGEQP
jgi:hypothetical protein